MITATDLELRAGSRILLSDATLRVQAGDRIGLVGRNGAGKTTSLRVLAGEGQPYAGDITFLRHDGAYPFPGSKDAVTTYWHELALGELDIVDIGGDHYSCLSVSQINVSVVLCKSQTSLTQSSTWTFLVPVGCLVTSPL